MGLELFYSSGYIIAHRFDVKKQQLLEFPEMDLCNFLFN